MYSLRFTPQAHRALQRSAPPIRALLLQLLQGTAQLAALFPPGSGMWRKLGRGTRHGLEVELEGWVLLLRVVHDREELHVVRAVRASARTRKPASAALESASPARSRALRGE